MLSTQFTREQPKLEKNYSVHLNHLAYVMLVVEKELCALVDEDCKLVQQGRLGASALKVEQLSTRVDKYLLGAHWLLRGLKGQGAATHTKSWASRQVEALIDFQRILGDLKHEE